MGQQRILLRLVPAMHLIYKQRCPLPIQFPPLPRLVNRLPNFLHPGQNGVDGDKVALGAVGNNHRQRRFAGAGRAIEDERRKLVSLDGAAQQPAGTDDMVLSHVLIEGARPHPVCQR